MPSIPHNNNHHQKVLYVVVETRENEDHKIKSAVRSHPK